MSLRCGSLALETSAAAFSRSPLKRSPSGMKKKVSNAPTEHFNNSVQQQVAGVAGVVEAAFPQWPCRNNQHSKEVIRHKCSCHQRGGRVLNRDHNRLFQVRKKERGRCKCGIVRCPSAIWIAHTFSWWSQRPPFASGGSNTDRDKGGQSPVEFSAEQVGCWRRSATIIYSVWCRSNVAAQ